MVRSSGIKKGVCFLISLGIVVAGREAYAQCELTKLIASGASAEDRCDKVAIDGDIAVLACPLDDTPTSNAGSIHVFRRQTPALWTEVAGQIASDPQAQGALGAGLSLDGDTVIAGANAQDSKGAAYIFQRDVGGTDNWGQVKKLQPADLGSGNAFGNFVSISGDSAVASAYLQNSGTGAVYVFERNDGGANNWGQVKKLTPALANTSFGWAVAIHGDTLIVGALLDDEMGTDAGAAFVYERNLGGANNWGFRKKLTKSNAAAMDWFGHTLAIDVDTVAIGVIKIYAAPASPGEVCIFERNAGGNDNWGEVVCHSASDTPGHDEFGRGLGISGDLLVVGACLDNSADDGSAYILQRNNGGLNNWGEVQIILSSDLAADDRFGSYAALSGNTAIISSFLDDNAAGANAGSAYIFHVGTGCPPIPTVSEWGLVFLTLTGLAIGTVLFRAKRRRLPV